MQAKVSEIFLSHQGEGPFAGSRQLFLRFFECNLSCDFCDTTLESYKSFSAETLLGNVLDFGDNYNELVLTGGEPLLYAEFLKGFLPFFRKHRKHRVYLETNGTLPDALSEVIDYVDIVAMDLKLPSSTGCAEDLWPRHEKFVRIAGRKELIIKAIVTDTTVMDDIKHIPCVLREVENDFSIILQPVTPVADIAAPDEEMLSYFKKFLENETCKNVTILGQMHKYLGIR